MRLRYSVIVLCRCAATARVSLALKPMLYSAIFARQVLCPQNEENLETVRGIFFSQRTMLSCPRRSLEQANSKLWQQDWLTSKPTSRLCLPTLLYSGHTSLSPLLLVHPQKERRKRTPRDRRKKQRTVTLMCETIPLIVEPFDTKLTRLESADRRCSCHSRERCLQWSSRSR